MESFLEGDCNLEGRGNGGKVEEMPDWNVDSKMTHWLDVSIQNEAKEQVD